MGIGARAEFFDNLTTEPNWQFRWFKLGLLVWSRVSNQLPARTNTRLTPPLISAAHGRRRWRWRSVPGVSRLLPGGFPRHALHRVQRGQGHLPLLCQQVQLLAHHCEPRPGVHLLAGAGDPEGGPGTLQSQPLPSLQQDLVVGGGGRRRASSRRKEKTRKRQEDVTDNEPHVIISWCSQNRTISIGRSYFLS